MTWTVTRQRQWPDGTEIVEISKGGLDYTNPDALAAKYPGEFQTFADPREAVKTAVAIAQAWVADTGRGKWIGHGATAGMTMPFDADFRVTKSGVRGITKLRAWAEAAYEKLPKCDGCGGVIEGSPWHNYDDPDEARYCSESCAQAAVDDEAALDDDLNETGTEDEIEEGEKA